MKRNYGTVAMKAMISALFIETQIASYKGKTLAWLELGMSPTVEQGIIAVSTVLVCIMAPWFIFKDYEEK